MMSNIDIEWLKSSNPILDVASRLGLRVRKSKGTVAISCIFHSPDKNPSLVLMPDVNRYECKSCGAKGDVIELVKKVRNLDFKEAVEWLGGSKPGSKSEKYSRDTYFTAHGLLKETQAEFNLHLGYYHGIPTAIIPNSIGEHHRAFSGSAKFLTVGETTLFKAGKIKDNAETIILTEGELKSILIYQNTGQVCWSGTGGATTFKDEWVKEFENFNKIIIIYDNDLPGQQGATKVASLLGIDRCKIVQIPLEVGKDITDYFMSGKTLDDFNNLLEQTPIGKNFNQEFSSAATNTVQQDISWPDRINERALYGLSGKFVNSVAPHSEADPAALLLNILIGFGSIVGDKPHIQISGTSHPVRLFGVLVGQTAKGRKGESWGYPKILLTSIDSSWGLRISSGLASGEGLISAVRDEIKKTTAIKDKKTQEITGYQTEIIDEGVKDKRLLVVESEFASVLHITSREGNILSAVIRDAWDTGDLRTMTKNSPAVATGAHISIIGHITKDELLKLLTANETGNGFANRFIWFCVQRSKALPFGGNLDQHEFQILIDQFRDVLEFARQVTNIYWDDSTKPMWEEIYPDLSAGKSGLTGALTSRSEAIVVRLACVYALLDKSNLIKPQHLLAALAVWDYAERSIAFIFHNKTGNPIAEAILSLLKTHPTGQSRTEISNYFGRNYRAEQLNEALDLLEQRTLIRKETSDTGGRAKEVWFTNERNS